MEWWRYSWVILSLVALTWGVDFSEKSSSSIHPCPMQLSMFLHVFCTSTNFSHFSQSNFPNTRYILLFLRWIITWWTPQYVKRAGWPWYLVPLPLCRHLVPWNLVPLPLCRTRGPAQGRHNETIKCEQPYGPGSILWASLNPKTKHGLVPIIQTERIPIIKQGDRKSVV